MTFIRSAALVSLLLVGNLHAEGMARTSPLVQPTSCDSQAFAKTLVTLVLAGGLRFDKAVEHTLRLSGGQDSTAQFSFKPSWGGWSWETSGFTCLATARLTLTHWPAGSPLPGETESRTSHSLEVRDVEPCLTRDEFDKALSGKEAPADFQCRSPMSHGGEPGVVQCWQGSSEPGTRWALKIGMGDEGLCVRGFDVSWEDPPLPKP